MTAITGSASIPSQRTISGVRINDVLDPDELARAQTLGHVRQQLHPTDPLAILNYTEVCAYEGGWTPVTLACRGLIHRTDTGEVVARGFNKFFNYGQPGAPTLDLGGSAIVTDKADGSLGILYPVPSGGWAVATRGSFASDQALHATALFQERYADFRPTPGVTTLFEIVYPTNRIVLDYAGMDDLILLGGVEIATGAVYDPSWFGWWNGPVTATFAASTLAEALAMEPRPNAEGVVVRLLDTGDMVKIKQADYVALHRIVTGLNARVVWQHMVDGKPLDELVAPLPDEFHPWCRDIAASITATVDQRMAEIEKAYAEVTASLPAGFGRKEFAAVSVPHPDKWALFLLLDGRDPRPELWKRAKPEPYLTPSGRTYGEDTA
jgi:RNA ligase